MSSGPCTIFEYKGIKIVLLQEFHGEVKMDLQTPLPWEQYPVSTISIFLKQMMDWRDRGMNKLMMNLLEGKGYGLF